MNDYKDLIDDLRSRINPAYAEVIGTESHERKVCADVIEQLIAERDVSQQTADLNGQALEETQIELATLKQKIESAEPVDGAIVRGGFPYLVHKHGTLSTDTKLYTLEGIKE